jgi:very-short-patch-repair endonuclease
MANRSAILSTFEIDEILRRIAHPQLGLVTVAETSEAGVNARALARRRESGTLVPVFAGVMRLGAVPPSRVQHILAASLAVPGSMIGAASAAVVHQMPIPFALGGAHPLVVVNGRRSPRTAGVDVVRTSQTWPDQRWCTTRVTTPPATLLLLPRFVDPGTIERCLDHCLAHRLASVRAIDDLMRQLPARAVPGRRMLLDLLAERTSGIGHRSGLEQRVRGWLNDADLRGWQKNYRVPVGDRGFVEVDFGWVRHKVALEVSPFFTHGSRVTQERDAERRRLLVAQGWSIVEATDPDLEHQHAFAGCVSSLRTLLLTRHEAENIEVARAGCL